MFTREVSPIGPRRADGARAGVKCGRGERGVRLVRVAYDRAE
jgi:hypothetical protein